MVIRAAFCCMALALTARPVAATEVVELYTSQGCSSCPPADRLLGRLAAEPGTVALTFPVDYWDYLGWKDENARPEFARRQRAYARARGDHAVFTPQLVINGREALIGSREVEIRAAIDRMEDAREAPALPIAARIAGDRVIVTVPAGECGGAHAALWIAAYRPPQTIDIGGGENSGRRVVYHHVVDRWQVLGVWEGAPMTVELPLADIAPEGTAGLAVILQTKQNGLPGPIVGATELRLSGGS